MNSPQQGFLLTRQTREINNQSLVDLWVKCDDHIAHLLIENEDAVTFILEDKRSQYEACLQKENIPFHIKPTALSTFNHDSVLGLYFKNTYQKRSATQFIEQLHLPIYESDIRLADRYLMERFICGGLSFIGNPVQKKRPY